MVANYAPRYDMLCFEGISLMLKIFLGKIKAPHYRLAVPPDGQVQTITVQEEVSEIAGCHGIAINLLFYDRLLEFGPTCLALSSGISSLIKHATILS